MAAAERTGWFRVSKMADAANDKEVEDHKLSREEVETIDGEILAMAACFEQIHPFSMAARVRIFTYLYARLGDQKDLRLPE